MAIDDNLGISPEDQAALRDALLAWKKDGVANPLIPMDHDVTGDGVFDSFGLDEHDELIVVEGAHLDDTVAKAVGNEELGGEDL